MHARVCRAFRRFANDLCTTAALSTLAVLAGVAASPAPRRSPPALGDDPARPDADRVQQLLADRLPPGWTVSGPLPDLGVDQVTVQIPLDWRGSPATAAARLCPDPDSEIWQSGALSSQPGGGRLLRIVVRFQGRDWAPFDCRG